MAVIGHAEIVVRAITKNFEKELKDSLSKISKSVSMGAGRQLGDGFSDGFKRSGANNMFGQISDGLRSMVPEAEGARQTFQSLARTGYVLQGALGLIVGGLSSVVVSIGPLIGSLLAAAPAVASLATAFVTLKVAMAVGKTAFGGIFQAVQNATKTNSGYAKSIKDIREEWEDLLFDAEAASYSVEEAGLNLEKAIENQRRLMDLPPNSAARREAELEVKKADLAYRRAVDRTKDLNEVVNEGFDEFAKSKRDASSGTDPFSELNSAQTEFAKRLIELNPKLDALKLKMSEAFLDPLYESVDVFETNLYPILERQLPRIAGQAGEAINQVFTNLDFSGIEQVLKEMTEPFEDGGRSNIQLFGDLLQNVLDIFIQILDATGPLVNDVLTFLVDKTKEWSDSMREGDLEGFFTRAGEEAGRWFTIIGNIFGGFGNLIGLTTGPGSAGDDMLTWFTEASEGFKNMFADNPNDGKKFFKDAMGNARSVFSSVGALIKEILGLADNPAIGEAFDTLKEGAPSIGRMLEQMINAGPSFADLIVTLTKIVEAFVDDGQLEGFFGTLNAGAEKLLDVVGSEGFKKIMDNIGPIIGALSAIGVMIDVVMFAFQVFIGYLAFGFLQASKAVKPVVDQMDKLGGGAKGGIFGKLGTTLKAAGIIGLIVLMVTKAVEFYNKFADFREMVDNTLGDIGTRFQGLFDEIGKMFDALFGQEGLGGIMEALDPIIRFLLELIIPAIGLVISTIINVIQVAVGMVTNIIKWIMNSVGQIIKGIALLFTDPVQGIARIMVGAINIFAGFVDNIVNRVIDVLNGLVRAFEDTVRAIGNSPLGDLVKDLFGWDLKNFSTGIVIPKLDWSGAMIRGVDEYFAKRDNKAIQEKFAGGGGVRADGTPKLAMGGTVYPSSGGTLVTVAEAGRPERIEPLNPNGLSNRDIAIMQQMGGGGGINITVNPSPGMNEKELAAAVSRTLAFEMRKGTI